MSAITPKEALSLSREELRAVERLERCINLELRKEFSETTPYVNIDLSELRFTQRVVEATLERFGKAGWNIKGEFDSREMHAWYVFSSKEPI